MKIYIDCESVLLTKSLNHYLSGFVVDKIDDADNIITDYDVSYDNKSVIQVSEIKRPLTLEKIEECINNRVTENIIVNDIVDVSTKQSLEEKLELIAKEFIEKVILTVKEHNVS